jgi:hypothetical protein
LDENLIYRFSVILQTVASGEQINITSFRNFAKDTANCYVDLYGWYNMPPTVHKLLIHGADIIENAVLPIGQLSEEAQEARNKDIKRFRECHSRKCSRMCTIEDIFNMLLISSDPFISSLRKINKKRRKEMFPDALKLQLLETDADDEDNDDE